MRFVKRVNDRGTITLPAEIRSVLDIREGDIVEFEVHRVVRRGGIRESDPNVEITQSEAPRTDATTPEVSQ